MLKIFVICALLVSISCLPTNDGVEKVHVAVETDVKPQAIPVPIEQVLKASLPQSNEQEPVQATPLKVAEPIAENDAAEPSSENNKCFFSKFTTTTTTEAPTDPPV